MEVVVFDDCVNLAVTYLADSFDAYAESAHVGSRVGNYTGQVVVSLSDSLIRSMVIQTSTLRVDCYVDETLGQEEAHDLGQLSRGLLGAMDGTTQQGTTVYSVKDATPGLNDNPDEITGKARYSFYVAIVTRGTARPLTS